ETRNEKRETCSPFIDPADLSDADRGVRELAELTDHQVAVARLDVNRIDLDVPSELFQISSQRLRSEVLRGGRQRFHLVGKRDVYKDCPQPFHLPGSLPNLVSDISVRGEDDADAWLADDQTRGRDDVIHRNRGDLEATDLGHYASLEGPELE